MNTAARDADAAGPDLRRLDLAAFAGSGGRLAGRITLAELPRLAASTAAGTTLSGTSVEWSVEGERRTPPGRAEEHWLRIVAGTRLPLECQRCLAPVETEVDVDRRLLFIEGEDAAAALDAEREEDVLALPRTLDLPALIEDELLLALPLVPRHERCPTALPTRAVDPGAEAAPNPFDVLAVLRRDGPLN